MKRNGLLLGMLVLLFAWAAEAGDAVRGRELYETRCTACHSTSVHGRTQRKARSCREIRAEVVRWNAQLGGTWSGEEIDDVTRWLNERYYGFPVENGRCATVVAAKS